MKSVLPLLLLVPATAMAHEGHGGVGLFHHLMDLLPAIALVAIAGTWWWARGRK
ncbi:hypothetical protein [Shewanella sp.]|uniref:hypothetical protein n=1 Tax=Shewanella sp. TaxID=50422 RepID=UPI003563D997